MNKPIYDLNKDKVRLFGVGRSGSTFIWNVCRILNLVSTPQYREFFITDLPVICTYRDWRDTVVSTWRVNSHQPSNRRQFEVKFKDPNFQKSVDSIKEQVKQLEKMKRHYPIDQILFLQYERVYHDFEYLFTKLEQFLDITIPLDMRFKVLEECHILSAQDQAREQEQIAQKTSGKPDAFTMVNELTRIHGMHIYYGMHGTWKYILRTEKDRTKLTDRLGSELYEWGYIDD